MVWISLLRAAGEFKISGLFKLWDIPGEICFESCKTKLSIFYGYKFLKH